MFEFTDDHDRRWTFGLTAYEMDLVDVRCGINLYDPAEIAKALSRPGRVARCLHVLCTAGARSEEMRSIGERDFMSAVGPERTDAARAALLRAVIAFFPKGPLRDRLQRALEDVAAAIESRTRGAESSTPAPESSESTRPG